MTVTKGQGISKLTSVFCEKCVTVQQLRNFVLESKIGNVSGRGEQKNESEEHDDQPISNSV